VEWDRTITDKLRDESPMRELADSAHQQGWLDQAVQHGRHWLWLGG
jgi:hypothetical protein